MISALRRLGKRRIFTIGALSLMFVIGFGFFAVSQPAFAGGFFDFLTDPIFKLVIWIIGAITQLCGMLIMSLIYILLVVAKYNSFLSSTAVTQGWSIVRDVANMFFVLVLLAIAIGTILQQQKYHYQTTLPKFIAAAILINFSKTICGLIIDFAQVVMLTFVSSFAATSGGGNFAALLGIPGLLSLVGGGASLEGTDTSQLVIGALLALAFSVIALVVVAVIVMMLVIRIIALWFLIILSPLAFFLTALPERGEQYASQWWEQFINYVVFGPVMAFFLWLSLTVVSVSNAGIQDAKDIQLHKELGFDFGEGEGGTHALGESTMKAVGGTVIGSLAGMSGYILGIGMLIMSLVMGQKLGGAAGGIAGGAVSNIKDYATGKKGPSPMRWARERAGAMGQKMEQRRKARVEEFATKYDRKYVQPLEKARDTVIGAPAKGAKALWRAGAATRPGQAISRARRGISERLDTTLERRFGNNAVLRDVAAFGARGKARREASQIARERMIARDRQFKGSMQEFANASTDPRNQNENFYQEQRRQMAERAQNLRNDVQSYRTQAQQSAARGDVHGSAVLEDEAREMERNAREAEQVVRNIDDQLSVLQPGVNPQAMRNTASARRQDAMVDRQQAGLDRGTAEITRQQAQQVRENGNEAEAISLEAEARRLEGVAQDLERRAIDLDRSADALDGGLRAAQRYQDLRNQAEIRRQSAQTARNNSQTERVNGNTQIADELELEAARMELAAEGFEIQAGHNGGLAGRVEIGQDILQSAVGVPAQVAQLRNGRAIQYQGNIRQDNTNSLGVAAQAIAGTHENIAQSHELASTIAKARDAAPAVALEMAKAGAVLSLGGGAIPFAYGANMVNGLASSVDSSMKAIDNAQADAVDAESKKLIGKNTQKLHEIANNAMLSNIERLGALMQLVEKGAFSENDIPRARQQFLGLGGDTVAFERLEGTIQTKYPSQALNLTSADRRRNIRNNVYDPKQAQRSMIDENFVNDLISENKLTSWVREGNPDVRDEIRDTLERAIRAIQPANRLQANGNYTDEFTQLLSNYARAGGVVNSHINLDDNGVAVAGNFSTADRNLLDDAMINIERAPIIAGMHQNSTRGGGGEVSSRLRNITSRLVARAIKNSVSKFGREEQAKNRVDSILEDLAANAADRSVRRFADRSIST